MEKENINPAHKILGKLKENHERLSISRLPAKTKSSFIDLANEDFCGDYGMTLKWLMDDLITPDAKLMMEKVSELESRIRVLEDGTPSEVQEEKGPRMCDGSLKRRLKK